MNRSPSENAIANAPIATAAGMEVLYLSTLLQGPWAEALSVLAAVICCAALVTLLTAYPTQD
jgi:type IV secretory pathway VirB2 component (pilin)